MLRRTTKLLQNWSCPMYGFREKCMMGIPRGTGMFPPSVAYF
jgi:hypothetical protein